MWKLFFLLPLVCGFVSVSVLRGGRDLRVVLDKNRFYDEKNIALLSVQDLVFYYGDREGWWGDMGFHKTRSVYHKLLLTGHDISEDDLDTLAFQAFQTRQAIKTYVRRRSYLHVRWASMLFDYTRNLFVYKRWKKKLTFEEIWRKYEDQVREEFPYLDPAELQEKTARTLINRSYYTNSWIDSRFGK